MSDRASEPRPGRSPDGQGPRTPDPSAVAAALERIRSSVHRWLDRIEALAPSAAGPGLEEAEWAIARGLRDLEERRAALEAEADRRERDWEARLEDLEHDRRLLAEAWERLEREQVAAPSPPRRGDGPPRSARPAVAVAVASQAARHAPDPDDAVDRAILRQFEELRRDVRRKAEAGGPRHP